METEQQQQHSDQADELQEMDLNVYEDDDDETLHRKLVAAKIARKRAEEDMKLLNNRISLLKQEESKAWKKIDETKKRAKDIIHQRERNYENQMKKAERERQKLEEEAAKKAHNRAHKEDMKHKILSNKANYHNKVKDDVNQFKEEQRD